MFKEGDEGAGEGEDGWDKEGNEKEVKDYDRDTEGGDAGVDEEGKGGR